MAITGKPPFLLLFACSYLKRYCPSDTCFHADLHILALHGREYGTQYKCII